jgi:hypothetical protein
MIGVAVRIRSVSAVPRELREPHGCPARTAFTSSAGPPAWSVSTTLASLRHTWHMNSGADVAFACTACGNERLDEGFIEDAGQQSQGYARWIPGPLQRGPFGGAKRMGRPRMEILALRCQRCGHLDLFANQAV